MNSIKLTFTAFTLTLFWGLVGLADNFKTANLNQFYYEENNAIHWQQRYNAAPTGSWEEQQARQNRDQAIQRAIQIIHAPYTFSGMHWSQIEGFADQMNQKYNAAASGSALESMYRQVRDLSYQSFNQELQRYVQYFSNDWRQILDLAQQMDQKYNAAPSGSQKENAYNQARRTAYQRIPQAVEDEIYRLWDFREVEARAEHFNSLYNSAASGSLKESIFDQTRRLAYNQAVNKFNQQSYSMPHQQLWQIQEEYHQKYNSAASGSIKESYYRQIRDQARRLIGG